MRKKILIGLIFLSACFVAGGFYITNSIDNVIAKLERIITMHQVEIMRNNLLDRVKVVQEDLLLVDSPHAAGVDTFVNHGERMEEGVNICFNCHHNEPTRAHLQNLQDQVHDYQKALSRVYTIRANRERLSQERQAAFAMGQGILADISQIIVSTSEKLSLSTQAARNSIAITKHLLIILVIIGPMVALAIVSYLLRHFSGSVSALIKATARFTAGDLDHEIVGLRDEFGALGAPLPKTAAPPQEKIKTIEETQRRYRLLFENAGDAIFILEAEGAEAGGIVSANRAAAIMHGYTVEELLTLKIQDLDTPEEAARSHDRIQRMLAGEWINAEILHRRRDDSIFPVEVSAGLLEFEDHKYILAIDRDITQRKQAEAALQHAEQLAQVGEMAAGLAHEIKNPLAGIKVSIEVLAGELELAPEDREVFRRIIDEINRIENLLKNLLNYARPPKPQFAMIDVSRVIDSAVKAAQLALKSPAHPGRTREVKEIDFATELGPDLPPLTADSTQLQQVLLNLLLNGVDAIPERGTITIKSQVDAAGQVLITVADTGRGIAAADLEKIFKPFFTTKPKGYGLGLSICKRLIEQHGGAIAVAANPGGGTVFTISLPRQQQQEMLTS